MHDSFVPPRYPPFIRSPMTVDRVFSSPAISSPVTLWYRTLMASSLLHSNTSSPAVFISIAHIGTDVRDEPPLRRGGAATTATKLESRSMILSILDTDTTLLRCTVYIQHSTIDFIRGAEFAFPQKQDHTTRSNPNRTKASMSYEPGVNTVHEVMLIH